VLEPRTEEALIRVERAVEILDRETYVMYRARRLAGRFHRVDRI
jgi:hypothetical protein